MTELGAPDAGMVTAELAVALPALVVVLVMGLAGVGLGIDQVRCADAVRIGARLAARGQPEGEVHSAVLSRSPAGARTAMRRAGESVRVEVVGPPSRVLGVLGLESGCQAVASVPMEVP